MKIPSPGFWLALMVAMWFTACAPTETKPVFETFAKALRYFENVRRFFPQATPPPSLLALIAADEEGGRPEGAEPDQARKEDTGEEIGADDQGPPEIPEPDRIRVDFANLTLVATSPNYAGTIPRRTRECPCETDYEPKIRTLYFNVDPRRRNPPQPDLANGLFPRIWQTCLNRVPQPAGRPAFKCQEPCEFKTRHVNDWALYRHATGTLVLNCWKIRIFHCELEF